MQQARLAVIPARGGSKRIPLKNIKAFYGKPIIAYSIEAAFASELFDRIIVSTDCPEIAEVARRYGAEVPFTRPSHLADDFSGSDSAVLHALDFFARQQIEFAKVCCIYATAPFIQPATLRKAFITLDESDADSAFTVCQFDYPIRRALHIDDNGRLKMVWPKHFSTRSQDLEPTYHDAGQFYLAKTESYLRERRFLGNNAIPIMLPGHLVQDIDTFEDWEAAEKLYAAIHFSNTDQNL